MCAISAYDAAVTSQPAHGLREQKKARTRDDLVEAAYAVVRDEGIAGLTAEAIAARAGVSRRTFFNYFPSVGSVLAAGVGDFFVGLAGGLDTRPAGEPLLDSLESFIATPADPGMFERIAALGRVGLGSEEARAAMQGVLHDWLPWLIELFRGRLHPDVGELYVVNLATAVIAAAEASVFLWAARTEAALTPRSVAQLQATLAESLRFVRTGFDLPDSPDPKD
jgi:AcrR family transcriptional regulator